MCGIAGILSINSGSGDHLKHLVRMTDNMYRRGPDDEGFMIVDSNEQIQFLLGNRSSDYTKTRFSSREYVGNLLESSSILALGHRRLSILDTSPDGHQPMTDPTFRYTIVFNGEIYNFAELKSSLMSLGHVFKSSSDTEVILAAYSEWGENSLRFFNGDFAFAIWDNISQSLFCARDRIGIKPFYYVIIGDRFLFSSDIKSLIASGLYHPSPDKEGLYLSMALGMAPRPLTAFTGVKALEQAHWMRIHRNGHIETNRYWNIPVGCQEARMSENEAVELIDEQLNKAVSLRLVSDVPIGTFMSGGIDSTLISAIASHYKPGISAFTLGYQDDAPELDEVFQAQATAKLHDIHHVVKRVDPVDSLSDLSEWIKGYEEPYYSIAANFEISKLVSEHRIKVVLNGLGGDELFAGYSYYKYHQYPSLRWFHSIAGLSARLPLKKIRTAISLLCAPSYDYIHTVLFSIADDYDLRRLFNSSFCPAKSVPEIIHGLYAKDIDFGDALEAISYMDLKTYIGCHHVHRVDQFTMANSVESRFPFLDHNLIEAAFRIPSQLKLKNATGKYILRRFAEKYIAPECLAMKKKGFGLPLKQWMSGPLKDTVEFSLERLGRRPEIQVETIYEWRQMYDRGLISADRIWHLVSLDLWFEEFIGPLG